MALLTADFIIFAINSAIRLNRNAQRAYADSIEGRDIILPLPQFKDEVVLSAVKDFFNDKDRDKGGHQFLEQIAALADLHRRHTEGLGSEVLTEAEEEEYRNFYKRLYPTLHTDAAQVAPEDRLSRRDMINLYRIRQLHTERQQFKPLAFVAGNLVKMGIDYFSQVPGALNRDSSHGKVLRNFLAAIDDIPFDDPAQSPIGNKDKLPELSRRIVPQLFAAATESLAELSTEITNDPKVQRFISATSTAISSDIYQRLDQMNADPLSPEFQETIRWGRLILHASITHSGRYVTDMPAELFDTNEGVSALIKATGGTLLQAIIQAEGDLDFSQAFSPSTIDQTLQAAFATLHEYPDFISGNHNGFREVLVGVSGAMAQTSFSDPSYLPELARLLMAHTATHLSLFQKDDASDSHPILTTALRELLRELSQPTADAGWRPRLGKTQLLAVTDATLAAVVDNPAWVQHRIGADRPILSEIVHISLQALAGIPREERLRPETFQWLLQLNLQTVAANPAVLSKIKWGSDSIEKAVLQQALQLVFHYVFVSERIPRTARVQLMQDLLSYALDILMLHHPDRRGLMLIDLILFKSGLDYTGGFDRHMADRLIEAALRVMAAHPDLISEEAALAQVVSGIAQGLTHKRWQEPRLLVELVRLTLEHTALNAQLLMPTKEGEAKYLLVIFVRELLLALSEQQGDNEWQPDLTPAETLYIVEALLETVIDHPEWLIADPDGQVLFQEVMRALMNSLHRHLRKGQAIEPQDIEQLLRITLLTAATSQPVLDKLQWGSDAEERRILEHALDLVFAHVFEQQQTGALRRFELLVDLLDYVMEVILIHHPNRKGLQLINLILFEEVDYSQGFDAELADEIVEAGLRVMQTQPDLVSGEAHLQEVVSSLSATLDGGNWRRADLLPELVRLCLEQTAQYTDLMFRTSDGSPRLLPAQMLQSLLLHLTTTDADGKWRPQLTGDQLLRITESLLETVLEHPGWLIRDHTKNMRIWDDTLSAVFSALRQLPAGHRIQPDTLETILWSSLRGAANSPVLLKKIKWQSDQTEQSLINRLLDHIRDHVYAENASAALASRAEFFLDILDFTFESLVIQYPDTRSLLLLDLVLKATDSEAAALDRLQTDQLIEAGLEVLHTHPELVAKPAIFQKMVQDIAGALHADQLDRKYLLPEFFRLVLSHTAGNLDRLMKVRPNSPRMLLVVALEQSLRVLTKKSTRGKWQPRLTDAELLDITELILEQVIANPAWISGDKLLQTTLESIYLAIGEVRHGKALPYASIRLLLTEGLQAVSLRKQLVVDVVGRSNRKKKVVLTFALEELMVEIYDTQNDTAAGWTLGQTEVFNAIVIHYLARLALGPADKKTVDQSMQAVREACAELNDNAAFVLQELLTAIDQA